MPPTSESRWRILARIPTIVTDGWRIMHGQEVVSPSESASHAARFLWSLTGREPQAWEISAFNIVLVLYAEHEFNASTFAARVTASTLSDIYAAITTAIGTLKGPLHGGANEAAMNVLREVGSPEKADEWVRQHLARHEKVMGFGHRVYRSGDSRVPMMRRLAKELGERLGQPQWHGICVALEAAMEREKHLYANVDLYAAPVLYMMGIPPELNTSIFAVSRAAGWCAHVIEQHDPECGGTRLSELARSSRINGINIADACAMQVSDLAEWVDGLGEPSAAPLLAALRQTLDGFAQIGLGYLSLDRPSGTLSGGEAQRVKMIRQLGSSLTDVTYVFDEPTIGLHPHDIQRMNDLLRQLRDKGNTVLVVEHKPEAIAIADHVVDLGPGAGTAGGEVVFEGSVDGLRSSGTLTGQHLDDRAALKASVRAPSGALEVRGASTHNLRDVDVDIPLGVLVVVTGVAGSGKSSLIQGSVSGRDGVVSVDQAAIRGSRRSNPATYTGLLDPIRNAFAKANGVKAALFSANSEGACPNCNGAGVDLHRPGHDGRRRHYLRGVRGEAVRGVGAGIPPRRPGHQRGAGHAGGRSQGVLRQRRGSHPRRAQDPGPAGRCRARLPAAWASHSPRCPAASGSGSSWPLTWARRAASTSSTSRPAACTWPTSSNCSACWTGSSIPASRSSSSSTTRRSWRTPTGSLTSAPGAGHDGGRIVFEGTPADLVASRSTLTGEHLAAYVGA